MTQHKHHRTALLPQRYLVAGSIIHETVTHAETGIMRTEAGGVGALMAAALAQHGRNVSIVATIGSRERDREAAESLRKRGVLVHANKRDMTSGASVRTEDGEPTSAKGTWPPVDRLDQRVAELLPQHDWLLMDSNSSPECLEAALAVAENMGRPTVLNCTSERIIGRVWQTRHRRKRVVTANRIEAAILHEMAGTSEPEDLRRALNCAYLLISKDRDGWELWGRLADNRRSTAPEPPRHSDFVGCGDYATAGLCCALAEDLPIMVTINDFVRARMEANRRTPPDNEPGNRNIRT